MTPPIHDREQAIGRVVDVGQCGSCGAKIVWAVSAAGKKSPIDAEPVENGNVLLLSHGALGVLAVALSAEGLAAARVKRVGLRLNHWATCPDKAAWRAKTDAKRRQGVN